MAQAFDFTLIDYTDQIGSLLRYLYYCKEWYLSESWFYQ